MPYRRLPNTDQARIRALKAVSERADMSGMNELAVSLKTVGEVRSLLPKFEAAHAYYAACYDRQAKAGRKHQSNVKTARLYISHFIQVLNLSVIRSEIRRQHKEYYGLEPRGNSIPDLASESALAEWGRKIIDGEGKRISQGGIPIYNPAIAKVRVYYDLFMESYEQQKNLQALTARSLESVQAMRPQADRLILDIWNQVERRFAEVLPVARRLELCRDYGVVYYYRSGEKGGEEEGV